MMCEHSLEHEQTNVGCVIVEDAPDTLRWLAEMVGLAFPGARIWTFGSLETVGGWMDNDVNAKGLGGTDARFDFALVDLDLGDGSGLDAIARMRRLSPELQIVVITIYNDDAALFDALRAGARGYLLKGLSETDVVRYLHNMKAGDLPMSPSVARRMLDHFHNAVPHEPEQTIALTPREEEILQLIGKGMRGPEVARILSITNNTVSWYVKTIYSKLDISSRAEATLEAVRRNLI